MAPEKRSVARGAGEDKKKKYESLDVYIRMNEDPTKDYCFNVASTAPVSSLFKVFETIPILLSPSYFFHSMPVGFAVSVHPGYLTAEGALLFGEKAHHSKWLKTLPLDEPIGEQIAEGQLVVPLWKPNNTRQYTVIAFLLIWLYLDLPDFISPTPGLAPSNLIFWLADEFLLAPQVPSENDGIFSNRYLQILFFVFHLAKVSFIYLILWNGAWHPKSLRPYGKKIALKVPEHEELSIIGWTGARRLPPSSWEGKYHDYRTNRAGGVVEAFKQGIFLKPTGYELKEGEGWNALAHRKLEEVDVDLDLLDSEGKFVVSRKYFLELAKPLSQTISQKSSTPAEDLEMIKNFRSFGYLDGPKVLTELFDDLIPMHKKHA